MERDWLLAAALERRHDGPPPPGAAVPADYAAPWAAQLANRRRWAWRDVRRIGRRLARAGRAHDLAQWRRLRRELAFALRVWRAWRDWGREAEAVRNTGNNELIGNWHRSR